MRNTVLYFNAKRTPSEIQFLRQSHLEAISMYGYPVSIKGVKSSIHESGMESQYSYYSPVDSYLVFEEEPKPVLKRLDWSLEHEEDMVAYLGYQEGLVINDNSIITLHHTTQEAEKEFIVTRVKGATLDVIYYILMLSPYRQKLTPLKTKGDFQFLNRD